MKHIWAVAAAAVLWGIVGFGKAQADTAFSEDFSTFPNARWHIADYDFSHAHFDTDWRRAQVQPLRASPGLWLHLSPKQGMQNRFDGASVRRTQKTGYGRYEAVLQAGRGEGVVTGFFTYSGPYYGTRHDEIDIEFLGRDTTKMHVAWFVDGTLTNKFIDLGFDAADAPRRYAFEWGPGWIRWYVEDRMIYETTSAQGPVPSVPGYLFANIWAADPSIKAWAGESDGTAPSAAKVAQVRFMPLPVDRELALNSAGR